MKYIHVISAVALLFGTAAPAAASSTRYKVRHYPAAFTRMANDVLGSHVESYADGSVAIGFGPMPAPAAFGTSLLGLRRRSLASA